MANMNLKVTIPASGKIQLSKAFPAKTGDVRPSSSNAPFADGGTIYMQNVTFQNQSANPMYLGDSSTTAAVGGGLQLTASGSFTATAFVNYGTYLSDWWVAGTAGDVLFVLYIK